MHYSARQSHEEFVNGLFREELAADGAARLAVFLPRVDEKLFRRCRAGPSPAFIDPDEMIHQALLV